MSEETTYGKLHYESNELLNDSKVDDPPKYRLGAEGDNALGAISGDTLTNHGSRRVERTLIILKGHDPHSPNDSVKCGSIDFFCALEGREDDAGMVRVMTLTPHALYLFVPIVDASSQAPQPGPMPSPGPVPAPTPVPVPPPPAPLPPDPGETHGIPVGDFAGIRNFYGFPSEDVQPYRDGRMTWPQVIARMDARAR